MNLLIKASQQNRIPKDFKTKWNKQLGKVKAETDKIAIIFFLELLKILTKTEARFTAKGTVDYDMFGGCDFSWTISAGNAAITRSLQKSINDSWQSVQEKTNDMAFFGLQRFGFSWNGETGGYLSDFELKLKIDDEVQIAEIQLLGQKLYSDFTISKISTENQF